MYACTCEYGLNCSKIIFNQGSRTRFTSDASIRQANINTSGRPRYTRVENPESTQCEKEVPTQRLEQRADNPQRRRLEKLAPGGIFNLWRQVNIQRAITHVTHDVDVLNLDQPGSTIKGRILVEVSIDHPANEQSDDNRCSEVILEEVVGTLGGNRDVELSNEAHAGKEHANPAANDTEGGSEGEFVDIPTVILPCVSEADVGEANTTPNEQGANTGQSQQPIEDDTTGARGLVDESEETEGDLEENAVNGTSGLVDV